MQETEIRRMPSGAVFGVVVGCGCWSWLLIPTFLISSAPMLALSVGVPSVLLTAGITAMLLVMLDSEIRAGGFGSPTYKRLLFGLLAFYIGVLLLLANHWIGPALREAGVFTEDTHPVFGVSRVPEWMPIAGLAAGAILLAPLAWRRARAT